MSSYWANDIWWYEFTIERSGMDRAHALRIGTRPQG
jgi:hypothetical protein